MWASVHSKIRSDPSYTKVVREKPPTHPRRFQKMKKNNKQRKNRIKQKLASAQNPKV